MQVRARYAAQCAQAQPYPLSRRRRWSCWPIAATRKPGTILLALGNYDVKTLSRSGIRPRQKTGLWTIPSATKALGFTGDAMRYGWLGTITQSIDNNFYGEPETAPDNHHSYFVSALSSYPNRGDHNTLISLLVFKPTPQLETRELRQKLHTISNVAQCVKGHYRFYAYTRPELALEAAGTAPAEAGWAAGTVATVCSSFVWLACQLAGVQLESANKLTTADDLESPTFAMESPSILISSSQLAMPARSALTTLCGWTLRPPTTATAFNPCTAKPKTSSTALAISPWSKSTNRRSPPPKAVSTAPSTPAMARFMAPTSP